MKITITISGPAASGKSRVKRKLEQIFAIPDMIPEGTSVEIKERQITGIESYNQMKIDGPSWKDLQNLITKLQVRLTEKEEKEGQDAILGLTDKELLGRSVELVLENTRKAVEGGRFKNMIQSFKGRTVIVSFEYDEM